jgi:cytochrome b561
MHAPQHSLAVKFMHWFMAIILISLLAVGKHMTTLDEGAYRLLIYDLHKILGCLVLVLLVIRIFTRMLTKTPPPLSSGLQLRLSQGVHLALYVLMFIMPVSGFLMTQASGQSISLFDLLVLPQLLTEDHDLATQFQNTHEILSYLFWILLTIHVVSAFYYHFILNQAIFRRITGK